MVGSWYLTHAAKNAVWTFMLPFLFLFCGEKCKDHAWVNMKIKGMQKKHVRCRCMVMKWLMQNEIHEMISDKCRNDMSITMPWRDAYAMHDMNTFTDMRAQKTTSSYLRIWGRSAPCVQVRRWYGPSGFPWQKTRPTYNACVTTWYRCTKAQ